MNEKKIWYEDIGDLDIDKDKVKNFHYPIIPGETIQFRESLVTRLVNLFKELKKIKTLILMSALHPYLP